VGQQEKRSEMKEQLEMLLRERGLIRVSAPLVGLARDAIRMTIRRVDAAVLGIPILLVP